MFDWNDLRHFLAVARTGSMNAAARSLGVNSSTVQRRVAALEKAIGRPWSSPDPTVGRAAQGQVLLVEAAQVEAAIDALYRRLATLNGSAPGRVRLSKSGHHWPAHYQIGPA